MISEKFEASIFTIFIEEMASWELGGLDVTDGFVRVWLMSDWVLKELGAWEWSGWGGKGEREVASGGRIQKLIEGCGSRVL